MNRLLFLLLIVSSIVSAKNCRDLCEKFGDYEAWRKMERGVDSCGVELPVSDTQSVTAARSYRYLYYTQWKRYDKGVWFRFKVQADPDTFVFSAVSSPPECADSYFFFLTPTTIGSDHMIGDSLSCTRLRGGKLECDGFAEPVRNARVTYRQGADGRFDLWFRLELYMDGRWQPSSMHLYTDAGYLYEEYYSNGRRERVDRYPVVARERLRLE